MGREVATEKRNLVPLIGRLVVFLRMRGDSCLLGGVVNTNLALLQMIYVNKSPFKETQRTP